MDCDNPPPRIPSLAELAKQGRTLGGHYVAPQGSSSSGSAGSLPSHLSSQPAPRQLMRKWKHANDFGVSGTPNREGIARFGRAIQDHMHNSNTLHMQGTYRKKPALLSVNPQTGLVVIRNPHRRFLAGWKMSITQQKCVLETASLGGG